MEFQTVLSKGGCSSIKGPRNFEGLQSGLQGQSLSDDRMVRQIDRREVIIETLLEIGSLGVINT